MGGAAFAALVYTAGDVRLLVVMYSINVFLTFSLSMFAMLRFWYQHRATRPYWRRRLGLFGAGFLLCVTILAITIYEKFAEGGWVTLVVTLLVIGLCALVRRHYRDATTKTQKLYQELGDLPHLSADSNAVPARLDPSKPTAAVLVNAYDGVGIHTVLNVLRAFPHHFDSLVFLTVGVVDSGDFKGEHAVEDLRTRTGEMLGEFVALGHRLGMPATSRMAIGTEVVAEAERLCLEVSKEFPRTTFFTGKKLFQRERWWQRLLHNETALAIQKRLQWAGKTVVTLPIRVREPVPTRG
jgi:K+ transporter